MKKKLNFLYSMKFGLAVLAVLVAVCVLGSFIQQGKVENYYLNLYGNQIGYLILGLGIDDVFHCWWVILLAGLLCLNLVLCSIVRFPIIFKKFKSGYTADRFESLPVFRIETKLTSSEDVMKKLQYTKSEKCSDGWYGVKGKWGIWGSWLCHLSLLMIIIGYSAGQLLSVDTSIYGVPGQTKSVEGADEVIQITIDDFEVLLRDDHTVEQYVATLTVENGAHQVVTGTSMVNEPLDAFGYRFYQNSLGWANVLSVYKGEELIHEGILCVGESYTLEEFPLTLVLAQFYPDFAMVDGQPMTLTPYLNNPNAIFGLYYEQNLLDMNYVEMEKAIQVDDYVFVLHHPQQYTLIQVLYDPTMQFVLLGGIIMLLSLYLSFYVRCEECWVKKEDGKIVVYGYAQRGSALYQQTLKQKIKMLEEKES